METQQSIGNKGISTFLSFGAKNVKPDILEKMLIGRQKTVSLLEQYVREIAQNGVNHQVFIIGPRGAGKTHMLRVLYYRVNDLVQSRAIVVSYFAEEEYGISGYLDFLIRVINAFMRWYDADRATLETQLNILRETPESRQEYVAETIISDYVGDKPLLILSENFDSILEALNKEGQSKLRAWLYRHNRISIIATSQATSPDLGREDRPFYGFFSTITLKKLTYEESLELLRSLAQIENNATMIEHLAGKGQAQVRAIHELVKGNHRLLVTFYEFLKADSLADLSVIFMKTMNDLKPYYETFIRFLPAQQQKILYYLALAKIPQKGTDIGKNCFIATTSLTKQLSELQRQHLIDALPDPTDKRNKLYDVSEPLLRIAIEIGEQREGVTALFIDFLALYYSHDEIKSQKFRFESLYQTEVEPLKKQKLYYEIEARERALKVQEELGSVHKDISIKIQEQIEFGNNHIKQGNYILAIEAFQNAIQMKSNSEIAWNGLGYAYAKCNEYTQAIEAYLHAIRIKPDFEWAWYFLGNAYFDQDDYDEAIKVYSQAIQIKPDFVWTWYNLGSAYGKQDQYEQAVYAFQKSIDLKPSDSAWYNLGVSYSNLGEDFEAIIAYQKAIELKPDKYEAWYNLGISYYKQAQYEQAITAYKKTIEIKPNNDAAWCNLGVTYDDMGNHGQAIVAYQQALKINALDDAAWYNLGNTFTQQGDYKQAVNCYLKAISVKPDKHTAWNNLGSTYVKLGAYIEAIKAYEKAINIETIDNDATKNLGETVISYLQTQTATEPELIDLETWLQGRAGFEIISTYVSTYRRVVFGKEEKALYELPKEQREFFEREILKRQAQ
ncbi:ATP-binding protein [Spirosoma sp.]|uniref:ATP-binding protein n=1 Tax=Spirosoma sp. TaxID=1899569 RepID=UPI002601A0A0|nr:ATP-binding protein [Spirosoma sp.]MCX6214337.1 tetratricopeptide repeat protein [Spirosoma sp.]